MAECTLKESAAINQILGRRWHALDRADQAKYYEMARRERAVHMQKYPGERQFYPKDSILSASGLHIASFAQAQATGFTVYSVLF